MAGSVNKVILVGNIGKGPEVRSLQSGSRVCNLSIATSESWKRQSDRGAQGIRLVASRRDLQRHFRHRG